MDINNILWSFIALGIISAFAWYLAIFGKVDRSKSKRV